MALRWRELREAYPRIAKGMALGYAVSERGACHLA